MPLERLADLETNWKEVGSGPPLLMLHCSQGAFGTLMGAAQALSGHHRCLVVDSPGHGRSEYDPARDYQLQATEAMIALLDREGPAVLLGHSYGGTIAARLAHMRPDLARALIVYEPPSFGFLQDAGQSSEQDHSAEAALPGLAEAFEQENWPEAARIFFTFWEKDRPWETLGPETRDYLIKTVRFITIQRSSLVGGPHERMMLDDLRKIEAPALVMYGDGTQQIAIETMGVMAQALPNATLTVMEGAGHMGPIKSGPAFAQIVSDWLATLPA